MKKIICSFAAASMAASPLGIKASESVIAPEAKVHWQCSTDSNRWVDMGELETTPWNDQDYSGLYLEVDQTTRYQTLTDSPWGGCFNERGWKAMENLSAEQRTEIVKSLYGEDGLRLTVGRLPLGNSDFSIGNNQSYDELPEGVETDYELKYFTIDNDREYLLPYINEALKINPDITFWASPWSPPAWMKQNGTVHGPGETNTLRFDDKEMLKAYADYFVKYVQAYENEGIKISMVMPQNEPTINVNYPSCVWSGEQLNEFIRDYLAPAFEENGLDTDIYLGTFTDSQANRTDPTLTDPVTSKIIKGVGFQWWSSPLAKRVYRQNKENGYILIQSETMCGGGANNWSYVESSLNSNGQFQCLKAFFESGVNAYMLWNMVLDEKGHNTNPSPWPQNAPIVVDSSTNEIRYNPQYYLFKHFTNYIDGGARRIRTDSTHGGDEYGDKIAFQNKDGEIVLEVVNSAGRDYEVAINFNGREIKPTLPAHSINTFTLQGDLSGFYTDEDATYLSGESDDEVLTMVKFFNLNDDAASLTVSGASFNDGAEIIAWGDKGAVEQQWILTPTDNGYYRLVSANSEKSIGIYSASKNSGAKAVQWTWTGSEDQQWKLSPVYKNGKTYYKLVNRNSGLCLTYKDASIVNGTLAVQDIDDGSDAFLWEARVSQGGSDLPVLYGVRFESGLSVSLNSSPISSGDAVAAGSVLEVTKNGESVSVLANGVLCEDGLVTVVADTVITPYSPEVPLNDYNVNSLNAEIPESGSFYVEADVTKNSDRSARDYIVIGAYSAQDELLDMICMRANYLKGQTVQFGGYLGGDGVSSVKAFVLSSLSEITPLGNTVTVEKISDK